jgi:energy-coupling factor transport system permease protein
MLTWRFLPLMQREATRIIEANQLRGIDLSRQPRYFVSGLFIPLIFRIVSYADEVTIGLETRGYDPDSPRSMSQPLTWSFSDTIFTITSLGLLLGIIYV